jgi:hypothetical protein
MLYQLSGKCNKNLKAVEYNYYGNNYNQNNNINNQYNGEYQDANDEEAQRQNYKQMYQSQQQAANEEAVCAFIESLTSNSYNENGEVTISGSQSFFNPASWGREVQAESKAMSAGMKAALIITAFAAAFMAVAACVLHGALARKNIPWRPGARRGKGEDPTDLARQNSGITMGRSRSGPGGSAPLI